MTEDKLYFALDPSELEASFSVYGNDLEWHGIVVNEQNRPVNDYLLVKTCERGSDLGEMIMETDEDGLIFNDEGEIIDQARYQGEEDALKEQLRDMYLDMDYDVSTGIEIDGKTYIRISPTDFCSRHQIGEVGRFFRGTMPDGLTTKRGIEELADRAGSLMELGDWDASTVRLTEYEEDEWSEPGSDEPFSQGWFRFDNDDTVYTLIYGPGDEAITAAIRDWEARKITLRELQEQFGLAPESATGLTDVCVINL